MQVTFSESEMSLIQQVTAWRMKNARQIGAGGQQHTPARRRERIGVMAEAAVAKLTGYAWHTILQPKQYGKTRAERNQIATDVGVYEVRGTDWPHGKLRIYRQDAELLPGGIVPRPYVLVIVGKRSCRLAGYQLTDIAKQQKYWYEPWGAYRVPQSQLRKFKDTRDWRLVRDLSQKYQLQEQSDVK